MKNTVYVPVKYPIIAPAPNMCYWYNMKTNKMETKQIVPCEEMKKFLGASWK